MNKVQIIKFNGGGTLIYQKSNRNKSTSVAVGFAVGTQNNTQNGIAHFCEHMLFKGTGKRTKDELEKDLREYCGNGFNAYTGQDQIVFVFNRVNSLLPKAMELASDILLNSNMTKKNIDNERGVILEEFNMNEDSCKYDIRNEHYSKILNRQFNNRIAIGNADDLKLITPKALIDFKKNCFTRENFIVSVVGSESLLTIKRLIKKYFLKSLPITENAPIEHKISVVGETSYQIVKKETDNVMVDISFKSVGWNDEIRFPVLKFIKEYLTGGVDGVLFKNVRDKGLAYSIYTTTDVYDENGIFTISFESSKDNIKKVIDEIGKTIMDIKRNGIEEEEIQKTKNNFQYYMYEKDSTNFQKCISNVLKVVVNEPIDEDAYLKKILNTTKEVIDEYFVELFDMANEMYVTIGGKIKQGEIYTIDEIKNKILKTVK